MLDLAGELWMPLLAADETPAVDPISDILVQGGTPDIVLYLALGALAAAVVRFIWGAIAWMALKHHDDDWRPVENPEALESAMAAADLKPGYFYALPHFETYEGGMKSPALKSRMEAGPNATIVPMPKGNVMSGAMFLKGFLVYLGEAVLLALLCLVFWQNGFVAIDGCLDTMGACAVVGLLATFSVHFAQSVWMLFPWRHTWSSLIDMLVGYALMGATLYGMARTLMG